VNPEGTNRVLGGRYRLVHEIARGGMAVVWEAEDTLLDRHVALKLLHPQFAGDPEFLERFRREARAAARLSHPNIVSIYDVGEDGDSHTPFIVMELVEGGNLKDLIRRSAPLADNRIRSIGAALAAALDYAHRRGLIHRDVKPQNVLIGEDGRPRLTDFGIAQAVASSGLTRTGAVMGSVHYLAPELVRGRAATPRSDVYGLGAVLYEMATGRVPFEGDTDLAIALAHVEQTPPAPRSLHRGLSPDLERIILRSMAKSPEQRFDGAGELAAELRNELPLASAAPRRAVDGATQRLPTVAVAAPPARRPAAPVVAEAAARRTARPRQKRGAGGGVLALLLAMTVVLVALGAGFFGLATLNREGPPDPTPTVAAARPTAAPKPAVVASPTVRTATSPVPAEQPTLEPSPEPSPSPVPTVEPSPSPSPVPVPSPLVVPPSPSPPRATATPRNIPVPQLRGKTLDAALAALQADGLTAIVRGVPANVDKDVVADESPDVGSPLPPGGTVTVIVGTGLTAIPDVANMPRDQAVKTLQNSSFRVNERDRRDQRVAAGNAIDTSPAAGTVIARNTTVDLGVSQGR
jgi:eukaryotic-like serine/threonine-protein kinase